MKIKEYEEEFPKRTLRLLQSFKERNIDYSLDITFLMNCMLGLLVTAVEKAKVANLFSGKVDDGLILLLPEKVELLKIVNIKGEMKRKLTEVSKSELLTWDKLRLLLKIRNGIAHQHINPINKEGSWVGITIWNVNDSRSIDFRMTLLNEELFNLAEYIVRHYQKKLLKARNYNG